VDASHLTGVGFACCMWVFGDTFEFRQSATPSFCDLDHKKLNMKFKDLFKSKEDLARLCHLRDLLAVAAADGKIEKSELGAIATVMVRDGMKPVDLERCMKDPGSVSFIAPKTDEEKVCYLKDMVLLMMCDGDIDKNEMLVCKLTAEMLGYRHEIIDALLMNIIAELKNNQKI
jgi:uncharacterized tellurite resistance protein B-like protein